MRSRSPQRSHLRSHWSVKTTGGIDSHFGLLAMHTCGPVYPAVRQRLAAQRPGCPWRTGGSGRGGSDLSPRARYGLGARGKLTPRPPPSKGSLPQQRSCREGYPTDQASHARHHRAPLFAPSTGPTAQSVVLRHERQPVPRPDRPPRSRSPRRFSGLPWLPEVLP